MNAAAAAALRLSGPPLLQLLPLRVGAGAGADTAAAGRGRAPKLLRCRCRGSRAAQERNIIVIASRCSPRAAREARCGERAVPKDTTVGARDRSRNLYRFLLNLRRTQVFARRSKGARVEYNNVCK